MEDDTMMLQAAPRRTDALAARLSPSVGLVIAIGRSIALAGVVLPLLLIGLLKFTPTEIEALKPLIGGTPWLAWLTPAFGEAGASYLLGIVEITTALLFVASRWSAGAGVAAGALGALTFATTTSIMLALPVWDAGSGGFPWLNGLGQFLIKDVALLGIALAVLGESLSRRGATGGADLP
jgi:reactive chlorine resistance protein C